jgi:hypothetical protein
MILFSAEATAGIFRCEIDGKPVFSDKPCVAGAAPLDLPPVNTIQYSREDRALAKAHDQRGSDERETREKANSEWHQAYQARKMREAEVRQGQLKGEVVNGMTPAQVRNLMGEPDHASVQTSDSSDKESWTYRDGNSTATVQFRNGQVAGVTKRKKKTSGGGSGKK